MHPPVSPPDNKPVPGLQYTHCVWVPAVEESLANGVFVHAVKVLDNLVVFRSGSVVVSLTSETGSTPDPRPAELLAPVAASRLSTLSG